MTGWEWRVTADASNRALVAATCLGEAVRRRKRSEDGRRATIIQPRGSSRRSRAKAEGLAIAGGFLPRVTCSRSIGVYGVIPHVPARLVLLFTGPAPMLFIGGEGVGIGGRVLGCRRRRKESQTFRPTGGFFIERLVTGLRADATPRQASSPTFHQPPHDVQHVQRPAALGAHFTREDCLLLLSDGKRKINI